MSDGTRIQRARFLRRGADYQHRARQLTPADMVRMRLPVSLWGVTRDTPPNKGLREYAHRSVADIHDYIAGGGCRILMAPTCTGKTVTAAVIAKAARAHRYSVTWLGASETSLFISGQEDSAEETLEQRCLSCDLLVVDCLETLQIGAFHSTRLAAIVRDRDAEDKATILTTSLATSEVQKLYGPGFPVARMLITKFGDDAGGREE